MARVVTFMIVLLVGRGWLLAVDAPAPASAPAELADFVALQQKASPEQLRNQICSKCLEALASVEFDSKIQVLTVQIQMLQGQRLNAKAGEEKAKSDYANGKKALEAEMIQIRKDLGAGERTEQRLVSLIQRYRRGLQLKKDQQKQWSELLARTDEQLSTLRAEKVELEAERRLWIISPPPRGARAHTEVPQVDLTRILLGSSGKTDPQSSRTVASRPSESLEEAMRSLQEIDKQ